MPVSFPTVRDIESSALDNGIRIITETMPGVRSVALGVWIGTGSRSEPASDNGISHFIEHMLFKGTPRRSAEAIARECDSIGGHMDAFTGRELVGFNMKVIDDHLEPAFDILSDLVLNPRFDAGDVIKEQGVVLEELKMDKDNPESLVHEIFIGNFWKGHGLGRPILGTRKTIRGFEPGRLRDYHQRFYHARNLTLTAAGNLRHAEVVSLAERYLGRMAAGEPPPTPAAPTWHPPFQIKTKRSLHQVHFCVGFPAFPAAHPLRYACHLLNVILGGSMSSRLFQNIRERQGLAYAIFSELSMYRDAGCLGIYGGTSLDSARRVVDSILEEIRSLKAAPAPPDELRRAKDHMKGSMMLSLESTSARMSNLARQWMYHGRHFTLDELLDAIEAVTAGQVQDVARDLFQTGRAGVALLGNLNSFRLEPGDLAC